MDVCLLDKKNILLCEIRVQRGSFLFFFNLDKKRMVIFERKEFRPSTGTDASFPNENLNKL